MLRRLRQGLLELVFGHAGFVEGVAAAAVRQREPGRRFDVRLGDRLGSAPRDGGARQHQVCAHAVDVEGRAQRGDPAQLGIREDHRVHPGAGDHDPCGEFGVGVGPPRGEPGRVGFERQAAAHHLGPGRHLARRGDVHGEAEPVQQLRAQLAFLRVHRSHQQERCRVRDRDAFALDVRAPHRRGIQQQVDEVVVQQVHLVDVEHAPVRGGEQAGLEGADSFGQGAFQVERADQPVLGGADRELN